MSRWTAALTMAGWVALSCASGGNPEPGALGEHSDDAEQGTGGQHPHTEDPKPEDPETKSTACSSKTPCEAGFCAGSGCGERWECREPVGNCDERVAPYCSCDGDTFWASANCPSRPFASEGLCAGAVGCNEREVRTDCLLERPACPMMHVPRVQDGCWTGECVPIETCACSNASDCPDANEYTCWLAFKHCGPYTR